jgi:hypothetical protein
MKIMSLNENTQECKLEYTGKHLRNYSHPFLIHKILCMFIFHKYTRVVYICWLEDASIPSG